MFFCGRPVWKHTHNLIATIQSYQDVKTANVIQNCRAFDLFVNHETTPFLIMAYQFQKFFPVGNFWGYPVTGTQDNGMDLKNNATKYNIASSGNFRVIGKNFIYGNGSSSVNCFIVINEF
jgi:hypothetical protein